MLGATDPPENSGMTLSIALLPAIALASFVSTIFRIFPTLVF
jgi:hypothetical protein